MAATRPTATIIVVSDRIKGGKREDKATPAAREILERYGFLIERTVIVEEGLEAVTDAIAVANKQQSSLILTCGGTGLGPRNLTPEASEAFITTRLHGVESHILIEGLKHSQRAGLCRGLVGLTSRYKGASLIVNAPSSQGGVQDALNIIMRLWPSITEWLH